MDLHAALDWLRGLPPGLAYGALFGGAALEYVFPPFPGDLLVVAGVALVVAFGWPLLPVALAVTLGAAVGGLAAWWLGQRLAGVDLEGRLGRARHDALQRLVGRFARHGAAWLALNRFVPGVRALFFVAAGLAGLRAGPVLFWALVGATLWNALLVSLGWALGRNVEAMATWVARYNGVVGVAVVCIVVLLGWRLWRAGTHPSSGSTDE